VNSKKARIPEPLSDSNLRKIGAGEAIRTLDPNLGKAIIEPSLQSLDVHLSLQECTQERAAGVW
jgi:hypothetical protein